MRNWLIRLGISAAVAAGASGAALAQTCPPPGYTLQDGTCYAAPAPGGIVGSAAGFRDGRVSRAVSPAARPGVVARRALPDALGSTVVLRGTRPANPNFGQPLPVGNGGGYAAADNGPPGALCPIGWDCDYDTVGFDRSGLTNEYDTVGFDRSGLTP